jgi:hypothetical protein
MYLSGVLMPLTNGKFQFKIAPLHGMTSKNTYMYPSKRNHRLWFIFYMLDKRASSVEAARKLTKGVHNIMSNGKVMYPKFQISKNSELVATTQNRIMEVHGPSPKGATTSCFYMIVEFEEPMSPNLITYDAGNGKILPKIYEISIMKRQPGMMILESWYSISRWRQGIIQPSTTRRRILMRRITLATGEYFLVFHYFLPFSS